MPLSSVLGAQSITKPGVCTSTTRPASPYDGQVIYETDSDTLAVYDGTGWSSLNPVNRDRNVIINGAMQVHQRGTSTASITTSGYYTADRWNVIISSLGTWTQSVENDAPTGSGFRKSLKMVCTTADASPAAGDYLIVRQNVEGQNLQQFLKGTSSAKSFTLTFWVKGSTTGTYICQLFDTDNTRSVSKSYTINAANTWEKKTIDLGADTTGAFDNDNGNSLQVRWWLGSGSNFTSGTLGTTWAAGVDADAAVGQTNLAGATNRDWFITGVQLEAGSVATPFEFEDISTTIEKCQRYYEKSYSLTTNPGTDTAEGMAIAYVPIAGLNNVGGTVFFKTRKRANPSITAYSKVGTSGNFSNAFAPPSGDVASAVISSPNESAFIFYNTSTAANTVAIHWVASSEL